MVDDQKDKEEIVEEGMVDDEEGDDIMDEDVDDVKDEDYIAIDDEEDEAEEEPVEEEVAKEVEELVKSSPEQKEGILNPFSFGTSSQLPFPSFKSNIPTASQPFTFGASIKKSTSLTMDDEVPKIQSSNPPTKEEQSKEPEISEVKPFSAFNAPKPTIPESTSEPKPAFRFGLPTTQSTFKPPVPAVSSSALKKEFKFGLPPAKAEDAKETEPPKSPRQLRSSSPAKLAAEEEKEVKPSSPKKRQRSASPRKQPPPEKVVESTASAPVGDAIEVQEPPKLFSFTAKTSSIEQSKSFSFGVAASESGKD